MGRAITLFQIKSGRKLDKSYSSSCDFSLFCCVAKFHNQLYIYIYSHPQTDCFVLSELFSVTRHVGRDWNPSNFTLDLASGYSANKRITLYIYQTKYATHTHTHTHTHIYIKEHTHKYATHTHTHIYIYQRKYATRIYIYIKLHIFFDSFKT